MIYQPRIRSEKPFPVADDFFAPVNLTEQRLAELRAEVSTAVQSALAESAHGNFSVDREPWNLHAEYATLKHFERPHGTSPTSKVARIVGIIDGDYRDVTKFFKRETRAEYLQLQKTLFSSAVDAAVVHTVQQPDKPSSVTFEGVKWAAYEPFVLRFRMDTCQFESMGAGIDVDGKPYTYRVVLPIQLSQVPDLFSTKRCARVDVKSVMILRPPAATTTTTELFIAAETDFKSNRITRGMYKRYLTSLHRLSTSIDAPLEVPVAKSSFSMAKWLSRATGDDKKEQDCSVCTQPLALLRMKQKCSMCCQLVCHKCIVNCSAVPQSKLYGLVTSRAAAYKLCATCTQELQEHFEMQRHAAPELAEHPQFPWRKTLTLDVSGAGNSIVMLNSSSVLGSTYASELEGCIEPRLDLALKLEPLDKPEDSARTVASDSTMTDLATVEEQLYDAVYAFEIQEGEAVYVYDAAVTCETGDELEVVFEGVDWPEAANDPDLARSTVTVLAHELLEDEVLIVDEANVMYGVQEDGQEDDDHNPDVFSLSIRSTVEIDTSEMTRASRRPIGMASHLYARSRAESTPGQAHDTLQSIHSSLYEQEMLLEQLQRAYSRSRSCA